MGHSHCYELKCLMRLQSYKSLLPCIFGLKREVLEVCSLVGSITNVVLNVALKAGIQ